MAEKRARKTKIEVRARRLDFLDRMNFGHLNWKHKGFRRYPSRAIETYDFLKGPPALAKVIIYNFTLDFRSLAKYSKINKDAEEE